MTPRDVEQFLSCVLLAAARCLPLFWLTPALAFGVVPGFSGVALALAAGCTLTPLYAASLPLSAAGDIGLWLAALAELSRGAVIALGLSLPALVLRQSGAIAEGLFSLRADAAEGSSLGRLCGLGALAVAASADGLSGALQLLLTDLGAAPPGVDWGALFLPLARLIVEAFELGLRLSFALLLGSLLGALLLGILGRLETRARPEGVGAALWPGLGLGLLCLSAARWLEAVPELMRGFAQSTARLLAGLP